MANQITRRGVPMNAAFREINSSRKRYLVFWGG